MSDTILVIDDQANVRTLLKDYLSNQGYRVVQAQDGQQGLFVARHEHPGPGAFGHYDAKHGWLSIFISLSQRKRHPRDCGDSP